MSQGQGEPMRLLYVEPAVEVADQLATFLAAEHEWLTVLTAGTAEAALQRMATEEIDGVLSEYRLPGMDGVEFLATTRKLYPATPFVLRTAYGSEAVASEAIAAGVTEYVPGTTVGSRNRIAAAVERVFAERETADTAQSELAAKANLFDQLFEQLPVSLYVKDRNGRHLYASEYHRGSTDVIGKTDPEVYPESLATGSYADDMHVIETGEPIVNTEEYNEIDDTWTLTSKVPWRGAEGEIKGLIGVTRIISEKKEYEQAIERKNERLEKFTSVVSHDLRNPLNVASGHLELLKEAYDDSRLDDVENALDRMATLIDDLLELARHGQDVDQMEQLSLAELAEDAWTNVATEQLSM
jgi:two-component system aerobic respiration control sensor histidine kinase ArcB